MAPVVLRAGEGERIGGGPARARIVATSASTDGGFTMAEMTIPPGFSGPPRHRHARMTDAVYVLEGTLTLHIEDDVLDAGPGSYVGIPPGTVHTFANRTGAPVSFLNITSPAGWEQYLREVAALVADGPPDPAQWAELMAKYDFVPAD